MRQEVYTFSFLFINGEKSTMNSRPLKRSVDQSTLSQHRSTRQAMIRKATKLWWITIFIQLVTPILSQVSHLKILT
jgi:hypothetical protein